MKQLKRTRQSFNWVELNEFIRAPTAFPTVSSMISPRLNHACSNVASSLRKIEVVTFFRFPGAVDDLL